MPQFLCEIEAMLAEHPDVSDAMAVDYDQGGPVLVMIKPNVFCNGLELRDLCAASLRGMAERIIVVLVAEIPQPEADYPDPDSVLGSSAYVYRYEPPATSTEQLMVAMWDEVLNRQHTGVLDDFLDLGGDSLQAVQLINRIGSELGATVDFVQFFDAPSLRAVAAIVDTAMTLREQPR